MLQSSEIFNSGKHVAFDIGRHLVQLLDYAVDCLHGKFLLFRLNSNHVVLLPIADWMNAQCSAIGATIAYFISASLGSVVVIRNFGERIAKWNEQVRQTCDYEPTPLSLLPSANIGLKYSLCITESTCLIT
jgi:hypothetical protein